MDHLATEGGMLGLYLVREDAWMRWPTTVLDYADGRHRAVYAAMASLVAQGKPLDFLTVPEELARQGNAEIPASFVGMLGTEAPGSGDGIVQDLREARQRRDFVDLAVTLRQAAEHPWTDLRAAFETTVEAGAAILVGAGVAADPDMPMHLLAWAQRLEHPDRRPSVQTGFRALDRLLGVLPRGELTIVASRPGVGKSALVAQIGLWNARQGRHVLFCSAEMTAQQVTERAVSQQTGVPLERVRRGDLTPTEWAVAARPLPAMRLCDAAGMTTAMVCDLVARRAMTAPLDLVIVDHLHHLSDVRGPRESRYDQIGSMVNRLKQLAKAHGCAVVVVCQLNREAADGVPSMAHLRDAGTIEEYANLVLLLDPQAPTHPGDAPTAVAVRVAKHRNGATGIIDLAWDGVHTAFSDQTWAVAA